VAAAGLSHRLLDDGTLSVSFSGDWLLNTELPSVAALVETFDAATRPSAAAIDASGIGAWDTGLVAALVRLHRMAERNGIPVHDTGLPEGVAELIALAFAVREPEGARRAHRDRPFLEAVGDKTIEYVGDLRDLLSFTGELVMSLGRLVSGRATYLRSHLAQYIQEAGAEALPIVTLISFLIGMIFAFVGVMQLRNFGAGIYTADLVGIAMVREMAPIMTAIIMAGRTGAAYAAEIGTMKVNEEIDALTTLGIHPVDFLVSPRVIALVLMLPMLTLYASFMGILGGTSVGLAMLDVSLPQYVAQTIDAIELHTLFGGLFKSVVYGSLVALAGCQQGMACGNSAMAVGQSTTKAVVMGIVLIVVSASILTIIYINLGI
jgi:phospholipid/cholesterol/gamma-HCH transport system permease protein